MTVTTCCKAKKRYRDEGHAIRAALANSLQHGTPLRPYQCRRSGWHLTRSTRTECEARREQHRRRGAP